MRDHIEHIPLLLKSDLPFSRLVMWGRLLLMSVFTILMILVLSPFFIFNVKLPYGAIRFWHRNIARITGIQTQILGEKATTQPVLFVANHISYIDIVVLSSLLNAAFVAKSEVINWPILGWFAKLQNTIFVQRQSIYASNQRQAICNHLQKGKSVILFPEGTSSDGNEVLPFKTSLFDAAAVEVDGQPVPVQPVTISYSRLNGMPMARAMRPFYAWYGDMQLVPHLQSWLGLGEGGSVGVDVLFHPTTTLTIHGNRKMLAQHCWAKISTGLSDILAGRHPPENVEYH